MAVAVKPKTVKEEVDAIIDLLKKTNYAAQLKTPVEKVEAENTLTFLRHMTNGKHPYLNKQDFSVDNIYNFGTIEVTNHNTHKTERKSFTFTPQMNNLLDMHKKHHNITGGYFIDADILKNFCRKDVDISKIVSIPLNQFTDGFASFGPGKNGNTVNLVNTDNLIIPKGSFTAKELGKILEASTKEFQIQKSKEYLAPLVQGYREMQNNPEQKRQIEEKKREAIEKSPLPKVTVEIIKMAECRLKGIVYTPEFSQEDHLKDIKEMAKKDPATLIAAIQKSQYLGDMNVNQMFNNLKARSELAVKEVKDDKKDTLENKQQLERVQSHQMGSGGIQRQVSRR